MSTLHVLDTSAIIALLRAEPGGNVVDALLRDPDALCYAHTVNLCEVFYGALRDSDEKTARAVIQGLYDDGLIPRRDMSQAFWFGVGRLKARGGISLADCFCVELGRTLGAEVVTSDRKEFDPLVPLGICPIRFIR
jgi:predicted nucleic acid-binding protein